MPQSVIQQPVVYYDYCALVVLGLVFFSLFFSKMTSGRINRSFIHCVSIITLTTVMDILGAWFSTPEYVEKTGPGLFYVIQTFYFLLRNLNLPVYTYYIMANAGVVSVFTNSPKKIKVLYELPYVLVATCLMVNMFHPFLFCYESGFGYRRLDGALLFYIESLFYFIACFYVIYRYRSFFTRPQIIAMMFIFPFKIIAILIQFFNSNMLLEMFATSCAVLIISITIHNPENMINQESEMQSESASYDELKRMEKLKRPVSMVLVYILNMKNIMSYIPWEKQVHLIKTVALLIKKEAELQKYKGDFYYLGNGKFTVISDVTEKEKTRKFSNSIILGLEKTVGMDGLELHLIPHACYFNYPNELQSAEEISSFIQNVQSLLQYKRKAEDLSRHCNNQDFRIKSRIDSILTAAIQENRFEMYYQPVYSIKQNRYTCAEALIRLHDSTYGDVSPEVFIPAAERNGLIYQIDDFVMDEVCRFIASDTFKEAGLDYVEMNLSTARCLQPDLPEKLRKTGEKYGVDFSRLVIEITERENISDQDVFDENMRGICSLGAAISLDDYGTGYSNIYRISQMPLTSVKIDRTFVRTINNKNTRSVVESTVNMLKNINRRIVVEGVETEKTLRLFEAMDCDYIQGFYYSKPLPEDEFVSFCAARNGGGDRQ